MRIAEIGFDLCYLLFTVVVGCYFAVRGNALFSALAFTLGFGDSFHLIPRVFWQTGKRGTKLRTALGIGKAVTSVTMTVFYVIVYHLFLNASPVTIPVPVTVFVYLLAIVRIGLICFPQNRWATGDPAPLWNAVRNFPFCALGAVVAVLLFTLPSDMPLSYGGYLIVLSFLFYLPVALGVQKYPKLGMLMIPKTLTYVAFLSIGFFI